jgi:16S rRNA processing protein RimM
MTAVTSDSSDSFVSVAKAVRARGLKGEIVADLLTDFPERFEGLDQLIAVGPSGDQKIVELEEFFFQNERIILKLAGCDTIEDAEAFRGYEFCVAESERVPLGDGEYYDFELEGCEVHDLSGKTIGHVQEVLKTGGTEILLIAAGNANEVMVPLAESIVVKIDTAGKQIVIDPPEGLLDLS